MAAMGQEQTSPVQPVFSASPSTADIGDDAGDGS
jgi:hypothetical protein